MHPRLAILLALAALILVPPQAVAQPSDGGPDDEDAPEQLQLKLIEIGWLLDEIREREASIWLSIGQDARKTQVHAWMDCLAELVDMQDHIGTILWYWPGADTITVLHDAAAADAVQRVLDIERQLRPRRPTLSVARIEVPAPAWPELLAALAAQPGAVPADWIEQRVRSVDGARIGPWVSQRERYTRKAIFGNKTERRVQYSMMFALDDQQRIVPSVTSNRLHEFGDAIGCRVFPTDTDGVARIEVELEQARLHDVTTKRVYGYPLEQPSATAAHVGAAFTTRVGECHVVCTGAATDDTISGYAIRLDVLPPLAPMLEIVEEEQAHRLYEFAARSSTRDRLFETHRVYAPNEFRMRVPMWWPDNGRYYDADDLIEEAEAYADPHLRFVTGYSTYMGYRPVTLYGQQSDEPIAADAVDPVQIALGWLRAGRRAKAVASDIVVLSVDATAYAAAEADSPTTWFDSDAARVIVNTRVLHDTLLEVPMRAVEVAWSLTQPDLVGPDVTGWAVTTYLQHAGLDIVLSATRDGDDVAITLAGQWSAFTGLSELSGPAWPDTDPIQQRTIAYAQLTTNWAAGLDATSWHIRAQADPSDDARILALYTRSRLLAD